MTRCFFTTMAALTLSVAAHAATKEAPKAAAAAAKPAAVAQVNAAAEKASGLFYSICADSMGNEKEFDKRMQALEKAKAFAKLNASDVKGINPDEAKNAWGAKGLNNPDKPMLISYNGKQNVCAMRVTDIDTQQLRYAFQADLKKMVDKTKGKIRVRKPETKGDIKAYAADIQTSDKKILQLGLAISKNGEAFLTFHQ